MLKKKYGSRAMVAIMLMGSQAVPAANLTVVQADLPAGSSVTVAGIKYQIMQFEVPAFGSDKIYLVKFPVKPTAGATASDYYSANVFVYGYTAPPAPFLVNTINVSTTGLSGFKAFYTENYIYNASYSPSDYNNSLALSNDVRVQLDAKTVVSLNLANKQTFQSLTVKGHIPDTTTRLRATPTALTRTQRNKFLIDSRALFKYVIVKEKQ